MKKSIEELEQDYRRAAYEGDIDAAYAACELLITAYKEKNDAIDKEFSSIRVHK